MCIDILLKHVEYYANFGVLAYNLLFVLMHDSVKWTDFMGTYLIGCRLVCKTANVNENIPTSYLCKVKVCAMIWHQAVEVYISVASTYSIYLNINTARLSEV